MGAGGVHLEGPCSTGLLRRVGSGNRCLGSQSQGLSAAQMGGAGTLGASMAKGMGLPHPGVAWVFNF